MLARNCSGRRGRQLTAVCSITRTTHTHTALSTMESSQAGHRALAVHCGSASACTAACPHMCLCASGIVLQLPHLTQPATESDHKVVPIGIRGVDASSLIGAAHDTLARNAGTAEDWFLMRTNTYIATAVAADAQRWSQYHDFPLCSNIIFLVPHVNACMRIWLCAVHAMFIANILEGICWLYIT